MRYTIESITTDVYRNMVEVGLREPGGAQTGISLPMLGVHGLLVGDEVMVSRYGEVVKCAAQSVLDDKPEPTDYEAAVEVMIRAPVIGTPGLGNDWYLAPDLLREAYAPVKPKRAFATIEACYDRLTPAPEGYSFNLIEKPEVCKYATPQNVPGVDAVEVPDGVTWHNVRPPENEATHAAVAANRTLAAAALKATVQRTALAIPYCEHCSEHVSVHVAREDQGLVWIGLTFTAQYVCRGCSEKLASRAPW